MQKYFAHAFCTSCLAMLWGCFVPTLSFLPSPRAPGGHEHDYERMFDVSPRYDPATPWLSGVTTQSTVDPPATTYIITGSAGNVEDGMAEGSRFPTHNVPTTHRCNQTGQAKWLRLHAQNLSTHPPPVKDHEPFTRPAPSRSAILGVAPAP